MKKLRAAFIGMAHIHLNNLSHDFASYPEFYEIVGMADVPPYTEDELKTRIKLNAPSDLDIKLWDDYRELLAQDIDIAVVCTDVKDHAAVVEEILDMGISVVAEKPMAMNMADAKRMYRAFKRNDAELFINWPIAWFASFHKAKELADSGIVGKVLRVHYRSPSTRGPYPLNEYTPKELSNLWWYKHERGGGSICDYACYGCVLSTWFTGKTAKRVSGMKKNFFLPFSDVEDYSVFTVDFGDSIGLIEGSWSTMNNGEIATGPVVYGSEGVIVADRFKPEVKIYKDLVPYKPSPTPNEVYLPEDNGESLALNLMKHFRGGEPVCELLTPDFNMKAMAAFDAGMRSCESGQIEKAYDPFDL